MKRFALAKELAQDSAEYLRSVFYKPRSVEKKADGTLVTKADKEVEKHIVSAIVKQFPRDTVVAEESGFHDGDGTVRWFIDPIDGTSNFSFGVPIFATSIAYTEGDTMQGAVISMPMWNAVVAARRGQGTTWNDTPVQVAQASSFGQALIFLSYADANDLRVPRVLRLHPRTRVLGSTVAQLALVASGRANAAIFFQQHVWDYAAGVLCIEEAGGRVVTPKGGAVSLVGPQQTADLLVGHQEHMDELTAMVEKSAAV